MIRVDFDNERWHHLLHFEVLLHHFVDSVRDEVHDHIQVDFFRLVSISVKVLSHFNAVLMVQQLQYLEFSILVSLVLEHFLYRNCLPSFSDCRFKHHSEWSISNDFLGIVSQAFLEVRYKEVILKTKITGLVCYSDCLELELFLSCMSILPI